MVRMATGGGVVRKTLRITNVGYRLLRSTLRVEPVGSKSIQVAAEFTARPFLTIDHTDIPVEIELPENSRSTALGRLVIESNGGTRHVEVLFERPVAAVPGVDGDIGEGSAHAVFNTRPFGELIAAQTIARRLVVFPLALLIFRLLVFLAGWIPLGPPGASPFEPRLGSIALVLAAAGLLIGIGRGSKTGDRAACGFTGAMTGLLASAIGFAFVRGVESMLGAGAVSALAALLIWVALGLLIALISWVIMPPSRPISTTPPELSP